MDKIDFKKVLESKKSLVWPEIEKYLNGLSNFPRFCRIETKYSSLVEFHQKLVSDYPQRKGKYLRPTLVLLTACAMGFPEEKAIKTAAAMQVSEDWILNHDDIEDDSLQRRGLPALHKIYGSELAINAGDGLCNLMWKVLIDNLGELAPLRPDLIGTTVGVNPTSSLCDIGTTVGVKGLRIMEEFYQMINRTIFGQTVEIKWTKENNLELTDEDIFFIAESKTGYYTIGGPMRLGAILAGATGKQLNSLYEFGKILGIAFQIKDDLLDLTGDFSGLKKQKGNDIFEGKRTIMLGHLLRQVRVRPARFALRSVAGGDRVRVQRILEKCREEKTKEEVNWVIEKMGEYGSLEYAKGLAEKFGQEALKYFEDELDFLSSQPARDQLKAGIEFIVKRDH